jgi:hypothetical protein
MQIGAVKKLLSWQYADGQIRENLVVCSKTFSDALLLR